MSWTVIAVLAGIGIGYLIWGSSDDTEVISIQFQDVSPAEASEIAAAFRPRLLFDEKEHWRPLEVSRFLSERFDDGSHQFCLEPTRVGAKLDCSDVGGVDGLTIGVRRAALEGRRSYLDLHGRGATGADYGRSPRSTCPDDGILRDCDRGAGSAIYYRVIKANDRWYTDYWWFLRYNEFTRFPSLTSCRPFRKLCDNHEGDWEGVTVVTKVDDKDEFEFVSFAQHKGRFRYGREQVKRVGEHPVVFVARGSHASYPVKCEADCLQSIKLGPAYLPEEPSDGDAPWRRNSVRACGDVQDPKRSCLRPLPAVAASAPELWNAWPGHWGSGCDEQGCREKGPGSPASPGHQSRYRDPECFGIGKRISCDGPANIDLSKELPELTAKANCDPWFGARVALVSCDPQPVAKDLAGARARTARLLIRVSDGRVAKRATLGVYQVLGAPLRIGARAFVTGRVPAGSRPQIQVKAATKRVLVTARFTELGLKRHGTAIISIRRRNGRPHVVMRLPNGRLVTDENERVAALSPRALQRRR